MTNLVNQVLKSRFGVVLVICLFSLAAHGFNLNAPFKSMDDQFSIIDNPHIRSFDNVDKIFTTSFFGGNIYYRPLVTFSFLLEYQLFHENALFYYLTNILIHTASAVLVFYLLCFILGENKPALMAALVFTIHPIHWEAIANIPGRSILLCAFFYLGALYCYCLAKHSQRSPYYYGSLILFVLALLSKESAIGLPALLFAYSFFHKRQIEDNFKSALTMTWPYALVGVAYLLWRRHLEIFNVFVARPFTQIVLDFATFLNGVFSHLKSMILPVDLYYDHIIAIIPTLLEPGTIFILLFMICTAYLLFKFRRRWSGTALFFLCWFWIDLFPVSQIAAPVYVQTGYISSADHFFYTPSISVIVFLIYAFLKIHDYGIERKAFSPALFNIMAGSLFVFLFLFTVQYNIHALNEIAMFKRSLQQEPKNVRVRNSLALAYAKKGLFAVAQEHYQKAVEAEPLHVRSRIGLAKALCDQGQYWKCLHEYDKVTEAGNMTDLLNENVRLTHNVLIEKYRSMLNEDPENAQVHYSLGVVYSRVHESELAIEEYRQALQLDPQNKHALYNLAVMMETVGTPKKAVHYYKQVVQLDSEIMDLDYYSYLRLGEIHRNLGDSKKSAKYFESAQAIGEQLYR